MVIGNQIFHVGGEYEQKFESWTLEDEFTIEESNATLQMYYDYPESFIVDADFCKNK